MNELTYGKLGDTTVIDEHGSTVKEAKNFVDSKVMYPIRRDYEVRHPASKENVDIITGIAQDLMDDPTKLDTFIKIEKRGKHKDRFYIVECFTKLVY